MQLLSLAGSLFLIVCSVAAQSTDKTGPCTKAQQDAGTPMPGKYIPQCTQYGFFQPSQCYGSTGRCWCVEPDTGNEIQGSSTFRTGAPDCTTCNIKRSEGLRPVGVVGNYVPTCDADGLFDATQMYGSTGQSWCVNKITGEEIPNSRIGPGQQRDQPCQVQAHSAALIMHSQLPVQGPCYAKVMESRGRASMPGFYTPSCTTNGYYKTEQTHGSTGYSWCVNPATGAEVPGTRRSAVQKPKATCGACFKEIEDKLSKKPMMGNELPQCNQENGDYVPEQHQEGYRFCVNPKTGAVEGKKFAPGDNTPLPCVNN